LEVSKITLTFAPLSLSNERMVERFLKNIFEKKVLKDLEVSKIVLTFAPLSLTNERQGGSENPANGKF